MNVLQVHHNWDVAEPGGIVSMMKDLMRGLEERGHHVDLLISDWRCDQLVEAADEDGRTYSRLNISPIPGSVLELKAFTGWLLRFPAALWRLRRYCDERNIDVAQLHYADALYLSFAVLRLVGGPRYVVTTHRGDVYGYAQQPAIRRWAFRRVLQGASAIVSVSSALADEVTRIFPKLVRPQAIHNGYESPAAPLPSREALGATLGEDLPARYAVMVGNCRAYKGFDIALRAWAELIATGGELPLLVVGGGPDLEALSQLVADLSLNEWVRFLGPVSRTQAIAISTYADIQIVPSRNEGQGIVILEAALAGTPVVCSDIPPFLEMVEPGVSATVFSSENVGSLAEAVRSVASEMVKAQHMAIVLQERVKREFSISSMVGKYEATFSRLLNDRQP